MKFRIEKIRGRLDKNQDVKDAEVLNLLKTRKFNNESWDNAEREKFIEAVKKYGKNNARISMHVGTKTIS